MNKVELTEAIGISLVTISRYISMGMPYGKIGGRYHFNINEVQSWISDNIDRRQETSPMTRDEAIQSAFHMLRSYVTWMEKRMCKECNKKFVSDLSSGKFGR